MIDVRRCNAFSLWETPVSWKGEEKEIIGFGSESKVFKDTCLVCSWKDGKVREFHSLEGMGMNGIECLKSVCIRLQGGLRILSRLNKRHCSIYEIVKELKLFYDRKLGEL